MKKECKGGIHESSSVGRLSSADVNSWRQSHEIDYRVRKKSLYATLSLYPFIVLITFGVKMEFIDSGKYSSQHTLLTSVKTPNKRQTIISDLAVRKLILRVP